MSLKQKAISGVKWTTISTVVIALIQLLQISILARFLDSSDFGLLAIVTLVIGFSQMFVDIGISSAIIHKQNVTNQQLSTLYWLNLISSAVVYAVIVFMAPYIASFYNDMHLTNLIILTSVTIMIQALSKQFFVLFEKELKFNILAKIDMFSILCSFSIAVTLAINGFGVYSLVYALISNATLRSLLLIFNGLKYHKPQFYFKISEVKEFIVFGVYQMGSGIVNYFNSQFDIIIIGKVFGSETLGLYSIIKQLVMRPAQIINPIITRVTFPTMAKVQSDIAQLKTIYLKTINYLSSINFPIYIAMIILAPDIITIFLGEKWLEGVKVFQILSLYFLLRSTGNPIGSLILAKGKPEYEFFWNIGLFFFIPLTVYLSSFYGIEGVSWGLVILMLVLKIPGWYFLVNPLCGAGFIEYHLQILKPLVISGTVGIFTFIIYYILKTDIVIVNILIVSLLGLVGLYILYSKFNMDFLETIKFLVTRNNKSKESKERDELE